MHGNLEQRAFLAAVRDTHKPARTNGLKQVGSGSGYVCGTLSYKTEVLPCLPSSSTTFFTSWARSRSHISSASGVDTMIRL